MSIHRTSRILGAAVILGAALAATAGTTSGHDSAPPPVDPARAIAPIYGTASPELEGRYLVILEEDADLAAVRSIAETLGAEIRHEYTTFFRGFAGSLSDGAVEVLRRLPGVAYLEHDQKVGAQVSWALDRIDQRNLPFDNAFTSTYKGAGVNIYVLDTGINPTHDDFGGRASVAYDAVGESDGSLGYGIDCNGHGTWVASLTGSTTYGVATSANVRGVRVLDCDGGGTAGVLAALTEELPSKSASQLKSQLLNDATSTFPNDPRCNGSNPPCWCFADLLYIY